MGLQASIYKGSHELVRDMSMMISLGASLGGERVMVLNKYLSK